VGACDVRKLIRDWALIDPKDGALTSADPDFRIGPALTCSEFRAADWGESAILWGDTVRGRIWKLDGNYLSESLSFTVFLYFEGERLAQIELYHNFPSDDPQSSVDYSKEQRRKASHDAWLTECLGTQRSFTWGRVREAAYDSFGGATTSIIIDYIDLPITNRPQLPRLRRTAPVRDEPFFK
jgi:hypothetical protein